MDNPVVHLAMILAGCKTPETPKKTWANITGFQVPIGSAKTVGAISEKDLEISVILPTNTALTALKPEVSVSEAASVSPASGAEVDFTHPTTYVVTAEDGSTKAYVVKITTVSALAVTEPVPQEALNINV